MPVLKTRKWWYDMNKAKQLNRRRGLAAALAMVMAAGSIPLFASAQTEQNLADEITKAPNGAVITLKNDSNQAVTIGEGKNLVLDLNGYDMTAASGAVITNKGDLTIRDSKGEGTIRLSGNQDTYGVQNNGTLTMAGGTIDISTSGEGIAYGINNTKNLTVTGGKIQAATTGNKWAFGIFNTGTIEDVSGGSIHGEIKNSSNPNNALGISTESGAVVKCLSGGTISAKVNNNGVAYGVRNRGKIEEIKGGVVTAYTNGAKWAFALYNEGSGVIDKISGGRLSGEIDNPASSNNALGISNEGTIGAITGGAFLGKINGRGSAYGLRNDKTVSNVSGGAYRGNVSGNAIYNRNGTFSYAKGYGISFRSNGPGLRYVVPTGAYFVQLCDEQENWVATYLYQQDGKLLTVLGDGKQDSYTVFNWDRTSENETVTLTADELSDMKKNTTLTVKQDDKNRPVYYFLGSSVTYGEATGGVSFVDNMAKDNDWICHKRAVSGTTLVDNGSGSYIQRMKTQINENVHMDRFICQLSTNDASQNKPLGTVSGSKELKDFDTSTIIGAMEYIIAYVNETWNCPVTFYTNPKYNSAAYQKMIDALYELQEKWGVGIIDFYNYVDMEPLSDATLRSYMNDDIHPNAKGYQWMADEMAKALKDADQPEEPDNPGGDVSSDQPVESEPPASSGEASSSSSQTSSAQGQSSSSAVEESSRPDSQESSSSAPDENLSSDGNAGPDPLPSGSSRPEGGASSPQTGALPMLGMGIAMLCAAIAGAAAFFLFRKRVRG